MMLLYVVPMRCGLPGAEFLLIMDGAMALSREEGPGTQEWTFARPTGRNVVATAEGKWFSLAGMVITGNV